MSRSDSHSYEASIAQHQITIANLEAGEVEDYEGQLASAQKQLQILQEQRAELERRKVELEELNQRKEEFVHSQLDATEKLKSCVSAIEREVSIMREDIEDLDQTRQAFERHLQTIESFHPEAWPQDRLSAELERAQALVDRAEDEFQKAATYFEGGRAASLFGSMGGSHRPGRGGSHHFQEHFLQGLAFNLPLILLGLLALLVYLTSS